jgi:hypothetical protein
MTRMIRMNWAGWRFVMTTVDWRWASIDVCWRLDLIVACSRSETTREYSRWELIAGSPTVQSDSVESLQQSPKSAESWSLTGLQRPILAELMRNRLAVKPQPIDSHLTHWCPSHNPWPPGSASWTS